MTLKRLLVTLPFLFLIGGVCSNVKASSVDISAGGDVSGSGADVKSDFSWVTGCQGGNVTNCYQPNTTFYSFIVDFYLVDANLDYVADPNIATDLHISPGFMFSLQNSPVGSSNNLTCGPTSYKPAGANAGYDLSCQLPTPLVVTSLNGTDQNAPSNLSATVFEAGCDTTAQCNFTLPTALVNAGDFVGYAAYLSTNSSAAPEPATMGLFASAFVALGLLRRGTRKA